MKVSKNIEILMASDPLDQLETPRYTVLWPKTDLEDVERINKMRDNTFVLSNKILGYWRVGIYSSSWADTYRLAVAWDKDMLTALNKAQAKIDRRDAKNRRVAERNERLQELRGK